jgi:DNA-binding NtrC family response regulator
MHKKILIVDDEQSMCEMLDADLGMRGFDTSWHTSAEDAFTKLMSDDIDVVLTDLNMPDVNGIDLCDRIVENRPDVPVVVITAFGSMDTAIAALRAGAFDFVTKPVEMDLLAIILERAIRHRALQEKVKILSEAVESTKQLEDFVGTSPPMLRLYDQLSRIADTEASVMIVGESGVGKELVAKALHKQSRRHAQPFVAVNCAAIPDALLESELFGHIKGAFTDARGSRKGLILQAEQGTLFLDEVGDLMKGLQPKLLRVLEERKLRPIGSDKEVGFDVRVVAATKRDLESAVDEGRFREDLFFRINVIQIDVPPLRTRGTDILLLSLHFLEKFAARSSKNVVGITNTAAEKLYNYIWPGNVRELRNTIERAVALTSHEKIVVDDLPEKIRGYASSHVLIGSSNPSELISMEEVERRYILHVLKTVGDNKALAARVLGFDRKTLYRKLLRYDSSSGAKKDYP